MYWIHRAISTLWGSEEAVAAADAAIIVVSGKDGIQVGTQKAWELCEKYKLPRMFFVTEMDIDDVSYRQVVEDLTEMYGKKIAPIHMPIREDGKFVGYVNIVKQAGRKYIDRGKKKECPVPDYLKEYLEKYHEILMESVAELSEEFMDRYFAGEEFSVAEVSAALKMNISDGSIILYVWVLLLISRALPICWTISADISQARTRDPARESILRLMRSSRQTTILPRQNPPMYSRLL